MVIRIYFSDGSDIIRPISDHELFQFGFLEKTDFINYLEEFLNYGVEWYRFYYGGNYKFNIETIDLRDAITDIVENLTEINNKKVIKFEYLDTNSYEYNVAVLGMDHPSNNVYLRKLEVEPTNYGQPSYDNYY